MSATPASRAANQAAATVSATVFRPAEKSTAAPAADEASGDRSSAPPANLALARLPLAGMGDAGDAIMEAGAGRHGAVETAVPGQGAAERESARCRFAQLVSRTRSAKNRSANSASIPELGAPRRQGESRRGA